MFDVKYESISAEEERIISENTPMPYVIELNSEGKNLICFGLKHTNNFSGDLFERLSRYISMSDVVLAETYFARGEHDSEVDFIIAESMKRGVVVLPADINVFAGIIRVAKRYKKEDILLLRSLYYLSNRSFRKNLRRHIPEVLELMQGEDFFSELYKETNMNEGKFTRMLEEYVIRSFDVSIDEVEESLVPSPIDDKTILNKIVREIDYYRDSNMIERLIEALKKFDRVLYVLGKNHIVRQENTIRRIFGE
jgi:hypothetical protein